MYDNFLTGAFGVVYKGILKDKNMRKPRDVAVKTVHGRSTHIAIKRLLSLAYSITSSNIRMKVNNLSNVGIHNIILNN